MTKILIIEDEELLLTALSCYLENESYEVISADNGEKGLELFQSESVDLVLTDLRMPGLSGLDVLKACQTQSPATPVIITSGTGDIRDSVEALRLGASDFLLKPFEEFNLVKHTIQKCLEKAALVKENRKYQEKLELMVEERSHQLIEANEQLKGVNRSLNDFAHTISHDLKSPLSNLKTSLDLLKDIDPRSGRDHQEDFDDIHSLCTRSIERMESLIRDILEYSQNIRSANTEESVCLQGLIKDVQQDLQTTIEHKKAHITFGELPRVTGSRTHLYQVFSNLIGNALKYSKDDTPPIIEIEWSNVPKNPNDPHESSSYDTILVKDNGIGFESFEAQNIFRPFKRLKQQHVDGSGIGLTTVKNIMHAHYGDITAEGRPNEGAVFTLHFLKHHKA